jgi:heme/copper-type cytochrome/quinol oxidase subunit 3
VEKPIEKVMSRIRIGLVILLDALLFVALILIYYIDQMVNGTLYYYGLISNEGWLQPYYLLSRLSVILIIAAIFVISSVELPFSTFKEKE